MAGGCVIIIVCEWPARAGNLYVTYGLQRTIREGSRGEETWDLGAGAVWLVSFPPEAVPVAASWKLD